jgi:hypothetical protein
MADLNVTVTCPGCWATLVSADRPRRRRWSNPNQANYYQIVQTDDSVLIFTSGCTMPASSRSMAQARDEEERRRCVCPACQERGKPCCLIVGHGVRTTHYSCTSCYREWQHAELLPDDVSVFRRPLLISNGRSWPVIGASTTDRSPTD